MINSYFTHDDHAALATCPVRLSDPDVSLSREKLLALHSSLQRRLRDHQLDLHPHPERSLWVSPLSAVSRAPISGLTLTYMRPHEQARSVERMMGRDARCAIDPHRHPIFEVRLTPQHFSIELIIAPSAWWDQRNLVAKLSLPRHRQTLRELVSRLPGDVLFGFWDGLTLSDAHLSPRQLVRGDILEQFFATFSDGHDWLRIGTWYDPGHEALSTENIVYEATRRIHALYPLYTYAMWTSNNNFHAFYSGADAVSMRYGREM